MDNPLTLKQRALILASFVAAMVLTIVPLPGAIRLLRPDWVALVLVYWCMALPVRIGVGSGWVLGLFLDVLYGSLLGEQALAKALLAYLTLRFTLSHPGLSTTIVGTSRLDHLASNIAMAEKGPLPADLYEEAKRRFGGTPA